MLSIVLRRENEISNLVTSYSVYTHIYIYIFNQSCTYKPYSAVYMHDFVTDNESNRVQSNFIKTNEVVIFVS